MLLYTEGAEFLEEKKSEDNPQIKFSSVFFYAGYCSYDISGFSVATPYLITRLDCFNCTVSAVTRTLKPISI